MIEMIIFDEEIESQNVVDKAAQESWILHFWVSCRIDDILSKLRPHAQRRSSKQILLMWGKNKEEILWRNRALKPLETAIQ